MLVSKQALKLAGITKDTRFKKEEGIMFRFEDGSPTGLFTDFGTQAAVGRAAYHRRDGRWMMPDTDAEEDEQLRHYLP